MARVVINGFGRIGRAVFKIALEHPELEIVAVNDLVPPDNLAYLLRYDTVYGRFERNVSSDVGHLTVEGREFRVLKEKDPAAQPWKEMEVDIVFECSGHFTGREGMEKHLQAGAGLVLLSTASKSDDVPTVVYGANWIEDPAVRMISCASCTTNCITPVVEILGRRIGVNKCIMTTLHAYTSTQAIVDSPNRKWRRGRAGAANFVPTSTGAAVATTRALPQFKGKFDGSGVRGPVPVGSISDIVFLTARPTSVEEINGIFREEAASERYGGVLSASDEEIVSSDIIRDAHASIVDLTMTKVVDGDLVKVMSWYDNEWGYSSQMVRVAARLARERGFARAHAAAR